MAFGVARRAALAAGRILCGATVSPAGTRLAPAAARDLLSPAARLLATGRSGPFAVPHPKRTDTLRFPARSLMSKGADPLSPASSGPAAGAGRPVTVFDSLFTAVKFTIAGLALLEATLYASTEFTKPPSEEQSVTNWSGTKEVPCARYVQPEDFAQLKAAVEWAHVHRRRLRPVGSALSPNGAAFNPEGMISLAMFDQIVSVDEKAMTVTVQAGAPSWSSSRPFDPSDSRSPTTPPSASSRLAGSRKSARTAPALAYPRSTRRSPHSSSSPRARASSSSTTRRIRRRFAWRGAGWVRSGWRRR